ncbi:unnamed protein product [Schistosoma rodhaini]|nr:unnamed protein product [Schistosoma rodhaini]
MPINLLIVGLIPIWTHNLPPSQTQINQRLKSVSVFCLYCASTSSQKFSHLANCYSGTHENIKFLKVSEISLHTDRHEVKDELKWTTEAFHAPLRRSETLSSTKSSGEVTITTDTVMSLHAFENMAPKTQNMTSKFSNTVVTNETCSLSTSHSGSRTTYSHYKRSILRQVKRQADNLRLKLVKERRTINHERLVDPLLSSRQRFV